MCRLTRLGFVVVLSVAVCGCAKNQASVTAVPLSPWNQCEPEGIPYYLPKPLLVVAKNVRHIDEAKVGLTAPAPIPNAFDNQAAYADLKANVTVPGTTSTGAAASVAAGFPQHFDTGRGTVPDRAVSETMIPSGRIEDGIAPDSFYTYQIIFVPDLSQKYGLRIKGGPGEIRAAMNLVNGWMYTGMGPYYLKDSSTAQNLMAFGAASMFAGRGAADVLNEVGDLARIGTTGGRGERAGADEVLDKYTALARLLQSQAKVPSTICNYAEIHIYEPTLSPEGVTCWNLIASHQFDRHYFQPGLNENAVNLFKLIIESKDAQSDAAKSQAEAITEQARTERAHAERSQAGPGSSMGSSSSSERSLNIQPDMGGFDPAGGNNDQPVEAVPQTESFGGGNLFIPALPPQNPQTNVDVEVNLSRPERTFPKLFGSHHDAAERPQVRQRAKTELSVGEFDSTVPSQSSPGSSLGNTLIR